MSGGSVHQSPKQEIEILGHKFSGTDELTRVVEQAEKILSRYALVQGSKVARQLVEKEVVASQPMVLSPGSFKNAVGKASKAGTGNFVGFYLTKEVRHTADPEALEQRNYRHDKLYNDILKGTITVWKKNWIFERGFREMLYVWETSNGEVKEPSRAVTRTARKAFTTQEAVAKFTVMSRNPYVYKYGSVYDQTFEKRMRAYFNTKKGAVTQDSDSVRGFGAMWTLEIRAWQYKGPQRGWYYQDLNDNKRLKDALSKAYEFGIHNYFNQVEHCMLLNMDGTRNETEEYIFGLRWEECIRHIRNWYDMCGCSRWPNHTGDGRGGPAQVLRPGFFRDIDAVVDDGKSFWFRETDFYGGNIMFCGKLYLPECVDFTDNASVDSYMGNHLSSSSEYSSEDTSMSEEENLKNNNSTLRF